MLITRLAGGMGNQMFQYAFSRFLSIETNTELKIDLSFLQEKHQPAGFVFRNYDLDVYNIIENFDIPENIELLTINEPQFEYSQHTVDSLINNLNNNKNVLINGYWQSSKYFQKYEDVIRNDFTLKFGIENKKNLFEIKEKINNTNSVAINIRRTDFVNNPFHGVIGKEYVDTSMSIIESKIKNPHYFIFSDDIEWCEENLKYENSTIVNHDYKGEKFEDYLMLMSECNHFIIPNSTFAWWSAWLNKNNDKIVISPKNWFTNPSIYTGDLIPESWIRV